MPVLNGNRIDVSYMVEPEFGSNVYVGDTITVQGRFSVKQGTAKSIDFGIVNDAGTICEIAYKNVTIKSGATVDFKMSAQIPEAARGLVYGTNSYSKVSVFFGAFNLQGGFYGGHYDSEIIEDNDVEDLLYLHKYSIDPRIDTANFVRFNGANASDEGNEVLCKNLKISINPKVSIENITTKIITARNIVNPNELYGGNFTFDMLEQAITDNGYSETTPYIFKDVKFDVGNTYEIVITIGDERYTSTYKSYVVCAFANMHLSGAENGGVAFGGFSSSTDDEPKFESHYKGYFYNGFDEITTKMIGNLLYPVGSIYINADVEWFKEPKYVFGGEWEEIDSRFLVSSTSGSLDRPDDVIRFEPGDTGGSIEHPFPAHQHIAPIGARLSNTAAAITGKFGYVSGQSMTGGQAAFQTSNNTSVYNDLTMPYTSSVDGITINTLPPYLCVRMWKRISLYNP